MWPTAKIGPRAAEHMAGSEEHVGKHESGPRGHGWTRGLLGKREDGEANRPRWISSSVEWTAMARCSVG